MCHLLHNPTRKQGVFSAQKDLAAKAAIPNLTDISNLTDTGVGSEDTSTSGPSKRRRNYTSLYVSSNNTGANT